MSKDSKNNNYHNGHRERMRERFDADPEMMTFQEHEMLEFLLNTVIPRKDTNGIAHELIAQNGSLYGVFNASVQDLLSVKNMTVSAAYLLTGIIPVVRKALRLADEKSMKQIINYGDAADFFHTFFMARNTECVCVLFLGLKYNLIKTTVINDLNPATVTFNVRNVAASAVKCGARYVIVGHNHPSGSAMPSENDFMLIWNLFNVLAGLDVEILDNFIFTEKGFLSFRNVGILHKFLIEYNYRNPSHLLKEDNKSISLYVTNLNEYLVHVTQLKQEKLAELITIDEFIKKNRPKINDVRAEKTEFVKNDAARKAVPDKNLYDFRGTDIGKPLVERDDKVLNDIEDQIAHGDMGEFRRRDLHVIDMSSIYAGNDIEYIKSADAGKINKIIDIKEHECASDGTENKPRKITASRRNVPDFIDIADFKSFTEDGGAE